MASVPNSSARADAVERLRAPFEVERPMTVGVEEELMVLDPATLDLAPRVADVLAAVGDDVRFKREMPAAQVEIAGPVCDTVGEAAAALRVAREHLVGAAGDGLAFAAAGVHPFAAPRGKLNAGERYAAMLAEYGEIARRQLVFGLHVHVAVSGADRALAVFNALRAHLPALAALGAAAPFYGGHDSGLASVRPKLCDLLPRQGVPPAMPTWDALADALAWGRASGRFPDAAQWWWEARLHPVHGTVEVRAPDAQATIADVAALAAVVHALVATLAAQHDAGDALDAPLSWRIGENRWSACRHGVEGEWVDPVDGRRRPMREHLHALLDELGAAAAELGCAGELESARDLVERPRARLAREAVQQHGLQGHVARLVEAFLG